MRDECSDTSMGLHISTCSYISTKGTVVHRGMPTNVSMGNTVVYGSTCDNDEYGMQGPKRTSIEPGRNHIGTDTVGKVQKGSYKMTHYIARGVCRDV